MLALIAHFAYLKGDFAEAEPRLRTVLARSGVDDVNRSVWVTQLGEVLFALGRFEESEIVCLSDWSHPVLEELTPTLVTRAMLLARLMVRMERRSEAVAYYRTALRACRRRAWGMSYAEEAVRELNAILKRTE